MAKRIKKIHLDETETEIQRVLLQVAEQIGQPLVLRIAGGWVRDKLMGKISHDLDIAIDKMNGEPFAQKVKEYMEKQGKAMSQVSKIQLNPEKSKHLETATARIIGLDIDFVNLRSEKYHEHTRNPIVEFGTPLEDALRRDLTINSLFYNLHTDEIEDWTGKGLDDLQNRVIRTPMPALQTFHDDPLRILRVIRFATRFNFTVCDDIIQATSDGSLIDSLDKKLSRERIGVEVAKMMRGPDPAGAIKLIYDFGCFHAVFRPPVEVDDGSFDFEKACSTSSTLKKLLNMDQVKSINWISNLESIEEIAHLYTASALVPFKDYSHQRKLKVIPTPKEIVLNSLKLSVAESDFASTLVTNVHKVQDIVSRSNFDRKSVGLLIRELGLRPVLNNWDLAVLLAMAVEISVLEHENLQSQVIQKYHDFMVKVHTHNLQNSYSLKPLLDGKKIIQHLKLQPGPQLRIITNRMVEWQLESGIGSAEEAVKWLELNFKPE